MSFSQWIAEVLAIAESRDIDVNITWQSNENLTFMWRCRGGGNYGTFAAGASMYQLTSPQIFTALWTCEIRPTEPVPANPIDRRGRFIPRVPAMAVKDALKVLFNL